MTDKNKLISLLDKKQYYGSATELGVNYIQNSEIADYLLNNIGSLPPCKLGDTFYQPYDFLNEVVEKKVSSLTLKSDGTWKIRLTSMRNKSTQEYTLSDIGKKIFESKEEAEKLLPNL